MSETPIDARACYPATAALVRRFKILKSTLPIKGLQIEEQREHILIRVDTVVIDIGTEQPKPLQFGRAFRADYLNKVAKDQAMGIMIRDALQYAMKHEIDEILLLDDKHFRNPHPP